MTDTPQYIQDFTQSAQFFLTQINPFKTVDEAISNLSNDHPELKEEFDKDTIFSKIFRIESCKILRDLKH